MKNDQLVENARKNRNFDLNLLIIFETIFVHKSVTQASLVLNVTPSAISQSLSKLRAYFSDPLFIREGNKLYPTTASENIYGRLKDGLNRIRQGIDYFSDSEVKNSFVIHASPYLGVRLLPNVCADIENKNLNFHISNIYTDNAEDNVEDILLHRKADIVFGTKPFYNFSIISEKIIIDDIVAVCSKNHPYLATSLTKGKMSGNNAIYLAHNQKEILKTQSDIENYYTNRNFIFSSNSIITNIAVTEQTNAVSFIPKWFYEKFEKNFNIKTLDCDFNIEPIIIYMAYNKNSLRNNSFTSLLDIIKINSSPLSTTPHINALPLNI